MSVSIPPTMQPPRRKLPAWVWLIVAASATLIALLIFVTVLFLMPSQSQDPPATSPPAQQSEAPTPAGETPSEEPPPTPQPAPPPVTIPSCAELNPPAQQRTDKFVAGFEQGGIVHGDVGTGSFATTFGPAAQLAFSQVSQSLGCAYPIHLEAGVHVFASELPEAPRTEFVAALRADGDFVETQHGNAVVFTWAQQHTGGHWDATYFVHAFVGDAWISSAGPYEPQVYTFSAIDGLLAANPHLQ